MIKFYAICRNTFLQTIRQPVYAVLIAVTFTVLVLSVPLSGWTVGTEYRQTDQKMLEVLGLSTLLISGIVLAAFSASSALSREIEEKTALTVIAKPVDRATFVSGKFAGVGAAVGIAFYLSVLVYLMTIRHGVVSTASTPIDWPVIVIGLTAVGLAILTAMLGNLLVGATFISTAVWSAMILLTLAMGIIAFIGEGWQIVPFGQGIRPEIWPCLALILMALLVLIAVAVAASTRLGQIMTLLVCLAAFALGTVHPSIFARFSHVPAVRVLGYLVPNLTYFYGLDTLIKDTAIPPSYLASAGLYCGVYVAAVLALGIAAFHTRELESQPSSAALPGLVILLAWAGRIAAVILAIWASVIPTAGPLWPWLGLAAALLVGGALLWVFSGLVARGVRWTYWVLAGVCAAAVLRQLATALGRGRLGFLRLGENQQRIMVEAIVAAVVMLILILPKTRRHFQSTGRQEVLR